MEVQAVTLQELRECPQCGECRGEHVLCLCDGTVCRYCRKNPIPRPIANYFDRASAKILHVPWFGYMKPCNECWRRAERVLDNPAWDERRAVSNDGRRSTTVVRSKSRSVER